MVPGSICTAADVTPGALGAFVDAYRNANPGAKVQDAEFYLFHPAYDGGARIPCVTDTADPTRVLGFAPVYLVEPAGPGDPHVIWTTLLADPACPDPDQTRQALLAAVEHRALDLVPAEPGRPVRLAADLSSSQEAEIAFLVEHGFVEYERYDTMAMSTRDASMPGAPPAGESVRAWRMPTDADQLLYLDRYHRCLPEVPLTAEGLRFLLASPPLESGTFFAAFDTEGDLCGSVLVYQNGPEGILDDIFVMPAWRRQGVGRCLVGHGLRYLSERGVNAARLTVRADNVPATAVYRSVGFAAAGIQEVHLKRDLADAGNRRRP